MLGLISTIILLAFVTFLLVNLLVALVFRALPNLLISPEERKRIQYIDRFEGDLKPYVNEWFGLPDGKWEEFSAEYRRHELNIYAHEPFSEYKHPERTGQFINISPHGFRHGSVQGAWPVDPAFHNIWFFGGSTALNVGPDWTCVSSRLQEFLNQHQLAKPVRVYNFGRGAYFSTLEKVLLFNLLSDNHRPDLAVFLDGVNDSFFYHSLPATHGIFSKAIEDMNESISAETRHRLRARPRWHLLRQFLDSLPLSHALSLIERRVTAGTEPAPAPLSEAEADAVINRWLHNRRQIEAVCASYGFPAVFVWQPTPAYKYDLANHIALPAHFSLHGHERGGVVYSRMRSRLGEECDKGNLIWLADIQEDSHEALYLDSMHYTDSFSQRIAELIVQALFTRGFMESTREPSSMRTGVT